MNSLNPTEDLEFIKKVIQDSKKMIVNNGLQYIVWGIIIVLGLLSVYLDAQFQLRLNNLYVWLVLIGIGWIYSMIYVQRAKRKPSVKTFSGEMLGKIWLSLGIALTIMGFIGNISGAFHGSSFSPIAAVLLGMAYFLSGSVMDKTWIVYIGIIWWISSIIMFFLDGLTNLLVLSLLMILLQIVPGIILYMKYKKEMITENE
ncbi:hypothetical protein ACFLR4_02815 [Bacteroidota bacterium]